MSPAIIVPKLVGGPYQIVGATVSGGAESTVLFDTSSGSLSGNNVTTYSAAGSADLVANVGSGSNGTSNRCLIVIVLFGSQNGGTSTVTNMHWDPLFTNQAFSAIPGAKTSNAASGGDIEFWYLMAPTLGDKAFVMNWTGNNQCAVFGLSLVGVDQTGGTTSFPVVNTSTSSGKTISISTTPTTRKLIGGFNSASNFSVATDNDIGHFNTMGIFAVAAEWASGANTLVSYGGGGSGCSLAVAVKGA